MQRRHDGASTDTTPTTRSHSLSIGFAQSAIRQSIERCGSHIAVTDKKVHQQAAFVREPIQYTNAAVPINQAGVKVVSFKPYQGIVFQYAIRGFIIENVQVWCTATAATAAIDVQISGVTALNATVTPVAATIVQAVMGALAARKGLTTDTIDVVITTNGTGTITNLSVTITIRPFPIDNEAA